MKKNQKQAIVGLMSALGLIVLLIGLFTPLYEFMYGLVAAIALWVLSGVVAQYLDVKK